MSNTSKKAGLVILPNNCATQSTCALCGIPGRMMIPFDAFTADGSWACGNCAAREWGSETVEALHGIGVAAVSEPATRDHVVTRTAALGWRMRVTRYQIDSAEVPFSDGELVRVTIQSGLSPVLAKLIGDEVLRRYAEQSPDVPF